MEEGPKNADGAAGNAEDMGKRRKVEACEDDASAGADASAFVGRGCTVDNQAAYAWAASCLVWDRVDLSVLVFLRLQLHFCLLPPFRL